MHQLIKKRHFSTAKKILSQITQVKDIDYTDKDNIFTPLQLCVIVGNKHQAYELINQLIDKGAFIETRGFKKKQLTPLQLAAKFGHQAITDLLIQKGANVDGDGYNPSPLHVAAYHGQLGTFQMLLDLGADIHYRYII